ncbi:MAG: PH domain-containing protein [[Clostridium] cellulosi]
MKILVWVIVGIFVITALVLLFEHNFSNTSNQNDIKKNRLTGISLLIVAVGTIIVFIPNYNAVTFIIALLAFIIIDFVLVYIILEKTQSFELDKIKEEAVSATIKMRRIITIAAFAVFLAILATALIIFAKPPVYTITDDSLVISTQYGRTINFSDIEDVKLKDSLPNKLRKRNGIDIKNILKGRFRADGENIDVFVDTSKSPFIYIYTKDGLTIINGQSSSETKTLFEKIKTAKTA